MKKLKGFLLGLLMVIVALIIEHSLEDKMPEKEKSPWLALIGIVLGVFAGILLASLASCATGRPYGFTTQTVLVENQSIETLKIYAYPMGARIGTIHPGRSECLTLPMSEQELTLVAVPIGGGRGSLQYSPPFRASQSFAWEVGNRNSIDGFSGNLIFRSPCK